MKKQPLTPIFLELSFSNIPEGFSEILIAELAEIGFKSFNEEEELLLAYIPETDFDEMLVHQVANRYIELKELFWSITRMPDKNWNEVWESSYEPVLIAGRCYIRAPFHLPYTHLPPPSLRAKRSKAMSHKAQGTRAQRHRDAESSSHPVIQLSSIADHGSLIELVIEPKMSFGTAHHETTALLIEWLLKEELTGEAVLDMGCGTGLLAILAAKMGAGRIVAIDNDQHAVENAIENTQKNNTGTVTVIWGDGSEIPEVPYDLILANINRNTLIGQIPAYAEALRVEGRLFLSGFYTEDLPEIKACAAEHGFHLAGFRTKNNWMAAKFNR